MPSDGLRVKPTPEPEFGPALPNTIVCTIVAVPTWSEMPLSLR